MAWGKYGRKTYYRRKRPTYYKRKTHYRRKFTAKRRPRIPEKHRFKREYAPDELVCNGGGGLDTVINLYKWEIAGSFTFSLDQVTDYTSFTQLFDQYKITGVKVTFTPGWSSNNLGAAPMSASNDSFTPLEMAWVIDLDDSTSTVFTDIQKVPRSHYHMFKGNEPVSFFIRPRALNQVYESSVSTGYGLNAPGEWLDCNDPTIPHYAVKYAFRTDSTSSTPSLFPFCRVRMMYYLEFQHVH
jgi:hypothetical protein